MVGTSPTRQSIWLTVDQMGHCGSPLPPLPSLSNTEGSRADYAAANPFPLSGRSGVDSLPNGTTPSILPTDSTRPVSQHTSDHAAVLPVRERREPPGNSAEFSHWVAARDGDRISVLPNAGSSGALLAAAPPAKLVPPAIAKHASLGLPCMLETSRQIGLQRQRMDNDIWRSWARLDRARRSGQSGSR
eukprot:COSAG02_NODE_2328_length_9122_cov_7.787100_3_plen_188_part_00